ncbi:hypothetical protein DVK02_10860 [Halobellus sp. Atlit-31R]|nr:hypothetical protein DVK02_10860 [Halobellus sp. Atlit-31R]
MSQPHLFRRRVVTVEPLVTPSAEHLDVDARRLASHPQNGTRAFPDGEVYVQLPALDDADEVVVIHSGQPTPNRGLAYLYGALSALADRDHAVSVLFTYVPYGRQDEAFYEGTLNYARSICRLLSRHYDVERIYAVDPHFGHREWVSEVPLSVLRAFPHLRQQIEMDDYVVVGPDLGAVERFGVPGFEKERAGAADVTLSGDLPVDGRNVLVFDDLIATGTTMVRAFHRLKTQGAKTVQAAAVHGVLPDGVQRVRDAYDALHLTNTIERDAATVGIEPVLRPVFAGDDGPATSDRQ